MANQTLILNVSDEMKLDDVRQELCGLECGEELCSSSLDTTEELYCSSATDTCRDGMSAHEKSWVTPSTSAWRYRGSRQGLVQAQTLARRSRKSKDFAILGIK